MREEDTVGSRKHSIEKTSNMAFWRAFLIGIQNCLIEIALGVKWAFQRKVSVELIRSRYT